MVVGHAQEGQRVGVGVQQCAGRGRVAVARLPAGEVRIIGVDLVGTLIEPKELEKISGLTGLKELYLPGPSWNPGAGSRLDANEELKFLAGLKNLEKLHFSLHFLTNVNVQELAVRAALMGGFGKGAMNLYGCALIGLVLTGAMPSPPATIKRSPPSARTVGQARP